MARGIAALNNLILKFDRIGDSVKTNFKVNAYFLYDFETHNQILKENELCWEVVASSKMLFNGLSSLELDLFKKLYRNADSRIRKQVRNHIKKFLFGEENILEDTRKDIGKELNLSFDMLAWITTHPLTDEQKKLSLELNSAAIPFIVKSWYELCGVRNERDEFKKIAKEHAKALIWMEFSAKKDQRKKKRLEKEVDKYKLLYEKEKKEKEAAKREKRQAEQREKKALEQKEKLEEEKERLEFTLGKTLDYSSRKEAVEIFSMDGSKKFQNLIGRLDASEKRSFYSSKSFFPTNKQGEQTDMKFFLVPRRSVVKKISEVGRIIIDTLSTQPTFANESASTQLEVKEAQYWVKSTYEDISSDQAPGKTYIIAGVTSADVNSIHPVLCTGSCKSTCLNNCCRSNGADLRVCVCYAASVTVHRLDKVDPCFKGSGKLNVHIDYEVGLLGRGLHARLCKFIECIWPKAIFHSIFRTNGIHRLCAVSEREGFTRNLGQAVYTAGVENSAAAKVAKHIEWYDTPDSVVLVKPMLNFRYPSKMARDYTKIASFNNIWKEAGDKYAILYRDDMQGKRNNWKLELIEEKKLIEEKVELLGKRKRETRKKPSTVLSMKENGSSVGNRKAKKQKIN